MIIRKATNEDLLHIVRSLQNKKISYNTTKQAKADLAAGNLYIAEENGKVLGSVVVAYKPHRNYHAILRLCVYNKKNEGKGIAGALVDFVLALGLGEYGATPWDTNPAMIHIFVKRGFEYQYTFKENYKFYKKSA